MFQLSHHLVSSFYEAKCFWNAKDGRSGSAGKADAESVETTAYALLSALSLRDKPTAKLTANWLTEQRKYGGGFQSTQVGCGILNNGRFCVMISRYYSFGVGNVFFFF